MLSFLVGLPGSGKSTFLAYLMSKAKQTILLPGWEEDTGCMLVPRLKVNGVQLGTVRILTRPDWFVPSRLPRLAELVGKDRAELVVLDPVDDYLDDGINENDNLAVRVALTGLAQLAKRTGAAVVATRHPGKDPANVMVGSRAWRAVPRSILELIEDPGPPRRRLIQSFKDSLGQDVATRYFDLVGEPGSPRAFVLGNAVAELVVAEAKEVPDRIERWTIDQAEELVRGLLADGEMEAKRVYQAAQEERFTERTIKRAAERIGVVYRREGNGQLHRSYWSLPVCAPDSTPDGPSGYSGQPGPE
jgi:hypothetical protein